MNWILLKSTPTKKTPDATGSNELVESQKFLTPPQEEDSLAETSSSSDKKMPYTAGSDKVLESLPSSSEKKMPALQNTDLANDDLSTQVGKDWFKLSDKIKGLTNNNELATYMLKSCKVLPAVLASRIADGLLNSKNKYEKWDGSYEYFSQTNFSLKLDENGKPMRTRKGHPILLRNGLPVLVLNPDTPKPLIFKVAKVMLDYYDANDQVPDIACTRKLLGSKYDCAAVKLCGLLWRKLPHNREQFERLLQDRKAVTMQVAGYETPGKKFRSIDYSTPENPKPMSNHHDDMLRSALETMKLQAKALLEHTKVQAASQNMLRDQQNMIRDQGQQIREQNQLLYDMFNRLDSRSQQYFEQRQKHLEQNAKFLHVLSATMNSSQGG